MKDVRFVLLREAVVMMNAIKHKHALNALVHQNLYPSSCLHSTLPPLHRGRDCDPGLETLHSTTAWSSQDGTQVRTTRLTTQLAPVGATSLCRASPSAATTMPPWVGAFVPSLPPSPSARACHLRLRRVGQAAVPSVCWGHLQWPCLCSQACPSTV